MHLTRQQKMLTCDGGLQVILSHRVLSMGDCAEFLSALLEKAHECDQSAAQVSRLAIWHPPECIMDQVGPLSHVKLAAGHVDMCCNAQKCMWLWPAGKPTADKQLAAAHAVLCMFYRGERALWTTFFRAKWCRI